MTRPVGGSRAPGEDLFWSSEAVRNARRTLKGSPCPALLLDTGLRIRWVNQAFRSSFEDRALGASLPRYFAESLPGPARSSLLAGLSSPRSGYSWRGRLEKRLPGQGALTANLLVLPLFEKPELPQPPAAFQGIFDDISKEVRQLLMSTYLSLLQAARLKDNDTGNHIERVNRYSRRLTEELLAAGRHPEVDRHFLESISFLAAMHDVGKIGTPDDILNKEGPLEEWEWEIMKEHTINGAYVLANYPNPMAREIALRHHEHWDGSGYPHGVAGEQIPLCARIVALADAYDALRMERTYKPAHSHRKALELILEQAGSHFDPGLVVVFRGLSEDFEHIFRELAEPLRL